LSSTSEVDADELLLMLITALERSLPLGRISSPFKPFHAVTLNFFKIHFIIIIQSTMTTCYLGTTLTNRNSIQEEIKSRLKSVNACYHSVQDLLSSGLLSKNIKIKIYRNIILPVVLYGCETSSLTLREENRLRIFENRVLRRIYGPKRDEVTREWRRLHNEELHDLYSSLNIIRVIKSRRMR
jgi:hypothetical protein